MGDILTPVDVGFAEFVAKLIGEVFDSIVTAQAEQEERFAALTAAASLSLEAFAERHLADEDLQAELTRLFPPRESDKNHPHAVYTGAPYRPAREPDPEDLPFRLLAGVELVRGDWKKTEAGPVLAEPGVAKVAGAVRERLAAGRLNNLRELVARGVPRVVVDSGRINGKLTFQLLASRAEETPPGSLPSPAPAMPGGGVTRPSLLQPDLRRIAGLPAGRVLPNVRVLVKAADERAPQSSQIRTDVYGEVEITFKTVT